LVRVYVSYPRVFGLLLLFLGEVEQQLKTTEVGIALKSGLHLPGVERNQFAAGLQKFIHQSVLFHAITSSWCLRVVRLLLMHGSLCKPIYTTTPLLLSKQEKAHSEALDNGGNLLRRDREVKAPKPTAGGDRGSIHLSYRAAAGTFIDPDRGAPKNREKVE